MPAEQDSIIEEEVRAQLDKYFTSLRQLDYEMWLECISKDNFIPGFRPDVIGTFLDYDQYVGAIKNSFARRVRQKYEWLHVDITPLSPELTILTYSGLFENWFKNENYLLDYCNATLSWKKEKDGWKIININEAWIPSAN